jgi:hypothetical protein
LELLNPIQDEKEEEEEKRKEKSGKSNRIDIAGYCRLLPVFIG